MQPGADNRTVLPPQLLFELDGINFWKTGLSQGHADQPISYLPSKSAAKRFTNKLFLSFIFS